MIMPSSLTRWCRRGGRFCVGCVNGALTLLALLQAIIVGCLLLLQTVPIPDWIVRKAEARLEVSGLDFAWENLSATFSGEVVLEGLEIPDQHSRQLVLRCERAVARFDLLGDPLRLKSLQLEDAAFHGPPEISPQPHIPLAHLVVLELLLEGPRIRVERALGHIDRLRLALHGELPIHLFDASGRPAAEAWQVQWFRLAEIFESVRPHHARAPDASLNGTFSMPAGRDSTKLAATLTAPKLSLPAGVQARECLLSIPALDLSAR